MQTIPVTDIRPGDLVDTSNAVHPGPVVRVVSVWTDEPSVLSPFGKVNIGTAEMHQYIWPIQRNAFSGTTHVDIHDRA